MLKLKLTNLQLEEIKEIAGLIKNKDLSFIRDQATQEWMSDFCKEGDMTARSWSTATVIFLTTQGYEIKKKP